MARYYFDTDNGISLVEDEEGLDLDGIGAARRLAQTALAEMARDVLEKDVHPTTMTVEVRDESGKTVFKAALALTIDWDP